MNRYCDLRRIIFWHGRSFAQKALNFLLINICKITIVVVAVACYNSVNGYSADTIYDSVFFSLIEVTITSFAAFAYFLLD